MCNCYKSESKQFKKYIPSHKYHAKTYICKPNTNSSEIDGESRNIKNKIFNTANY